MKLPKIDLEGAQPGAPAQPRTFWSTVLTSTPVILTVLSTVLAGLSSSELTQAQYHRSLAAQNQSKAGDQWSFFQNKRIRGTNQEMAVDLLQTQAEPGKFTSAAFQASGQRLLGEIQGIEKQASRLGDLLGPAKASLGAGNALPEAVNRLLVSAIQEAKEAEITAAKIQQALGQGDVQKALDHLSKNELPDVSIDKKEEPRIREASNAIQARQPESEIAPFMAQIPEEMIREAIERTEANIRIVEGEDKPITDVLRRLDGLVRDQVLRTRALQRGIRDVTSALAILPASEGKPLADLRSAAGALSHSGAAIKNTANDWSSDFKGAQYGYMAKRYQREANYNLQAAVLYELQVRKSSVSSERLRQRSKFFFYGMLVSQAGVTFASFSLAVRRRSLLWSLASLAGLCAILSGIYVYVRM